MSDQRWDRIKAVFEAALAVPPPERAAVLDRECPDDPGLRRDVESLLDARTQAFIRTAGAAQAIAAEQPQGRPTEKPGDEIGRYKLLQPIGEGGFGTVWMAEQREPVKRRVALKIIKLGMDTRQVIARFEAERQALAMMDHPNIAKVFDAGATDAGRPYFVMEYINGVPICNYCKASAIDTRARLRLFTSVCNAIQHAHQKGIIHRDIKPSNVLVTMHDGMPVPKVIDFGIAKATSSELTAKTLFTEHRQLVGTPAYMSPEQAEMSGLDIDTRSDIYSLGVLLYELLTGTTPFDTASLMKAGLAEMMRIIREVEPDKPSTRLSSLGVSAPKTPDQPGAANPKTLGLLLRGDLDWIVMKCLEKDRTRRYDTASGLASDISRHLNHEPVSAGPARAAYRVRKFVRRNRGPVIASTVVAAALVLGVVGTTTGLLWALDERDHASRAAQSETAAKVVAQQNELHAKAATAAAEAARQSEAAARSRAESINDFVITALKSGDAENAGLPGGDQIGAHDTTILAAMDNAIRDIDSGRFKDDPATESALRHTIGTILRNNGRYTQAEPLLQQSLAVRERLFGNDSPEVASSLGALAVVHHLQGRYAEADALYQRALPITARSLGEQHPEVGRILYALGVLRTTQGDRAGAESFLTRALANVEGARGPDHPDVAPVLDALAGLRESQGSYAEAETLLNRSLAIREKSFGPSSYQLARSQTRLAGLAAAQGQTARAEALWTSGLATIEKSLGPDHPTLAGALNDLALLYRAQGRFDEAEPMFLRALSIQERSLGPNHLHTLTTRGNLASLYWSRGRLDKSVPLFEELVQAREAALGRQHPSTLHAIANLGVNYKDSGRLPEAIPLLDEAYRASKQHRNLWFAGPTLLDAYVKAAKPDDPDSIARATALFQELLADARATQPKESLKLATDLTSLGLAMLSLQAWDQAEPPIREALAIRAAKAPDNWSTFNTRAMLGGVLLGQRKLAEAEPMLLDGYQGMKDREPSMPPAAKARITETLERLVRLYEAKGNGAEAAAWRATLDAARSK